MESFTDIVDILGTISFAISGVLTAIKKKMDVFGILIIAAVTSVGGGTIRDLLIGKTPVTWMLNSTFTYVIIVTTIFAIIFRKWLKYLRTSLFLFDTIGIAMYTIAGVEIGLKINLNPFICVALGTITACFGGVIRDILCTEIPIIFRKEIYASACIAGGVMYVLLSHSALGPSMVAVLAGSTIIIIRTLAVKFSLSLPSIYPKTLDN